MKGNIVVGKFNSVFLLFILLSFGSVVLAEDTSNDDVDMTSSPRIISGSLGDSASGLQIVNNHGSAVSVTGVYVSAGGCGDNTCNSTITSCYTSITGGLAGTISNFYTALWTPVSIPTGTSYFGQNYLYNVLQVYGDFIGQTFANTSFTSVCNMAVTQYYQLTLLTNSPVAGWQTLSGHVTTTGTSPCMAFTGSSGNCSDSSQTWNPTGTITIS